MINRIDAEYNKTWLSGNIMDDPIWRLRITVDEKDVYLEMSAQSNPVMTAAALRDLADRLEA